MVKTLLLLRHAKSSWADPNLADHDRPLAPRGRRASGLIATYLRTHRITPARVLCSSSARTLGGPAGSDAGADLPGCGDDRTAAGRADRARWQDVDWPAAKVRVRRSFVRGEFSSPKSRRGTRSVPLAEELAAELERHFQASAFQADDDLVFAHPTLGVPLDRGKVRKRFKAAPRRAGVREVRFHDLRHTFGTRMAGVGVPMRTLQEWMGHRDFKTTLIYADYSPSEHEAAWVNRAFRQPGPEQSAAAPA